MIMSLQFYYYFTIESLRKIMNDNINVKIYDYNDVVPISLITISQNYFNSSICPKRRARE